MKLKKPSIALKRKTKFVCQSWFKIAHLHEEKCELKEAKEAFFLALQSAKRIRDIKSIMDAIAGLLRLAAEALDEESIRKWDRELDRCISAYPHEIPPMAWYCKGAVARHYNHLMLAQRYFHRYVRSSRAESKSEESIVRGWVMLAVTLQRRNRLGRSMRLAKEILRRYEIKNFKGMNGIIYLLLGTLFERKSDLRVAQRWFQMADAQFIREHNWYYHLYVLYGSARIARLEQNYAKAYWYLELVDKVASTREFGLLRKEIVTERSRLEQDAVDLVIDSRMGVVKTRESGQVYLRNQYILLQLLEVLSNAHRSSGADFERGLSKAQIIESVWKETYRPEVHDNKLYYNINRLRKLIEPNVHKPRYLLNWKKGYRLAPGLRIHYINAQSSS